LFLILFYFLFDLYFSLFLVDLFLLLYFLFIQPLKILFFVIHFPISITCTIILLWIILIFTIYFKNLNWSGLKSFIMIYLNSFELKTLFFRINFIVYFWNWFATILFNRINIPILLLVLVVKPVFLHKLSSFIFIVL
jgi:hypothetical protein